MNTAQFLDSILIILTAGTLLSAMGLLSMPFRKTKESARAPILAALHRAQRHYKNHDFDRALLELDTYEEAADVPPYVMADVLHMRGLISLLNGDFAKARNLLEKGYLEAQHSGKTHLIVMLGVTLATALFECQDNDRAHSYLTTILPIAEEISKGQRSEKWDIKVLAAIHLSLAQVQQQKGDLQESHNSYETAKSYWLNVDYMQETVGEIDEHLVELDREIIKRKFGAA